MTKQLAVTPSQWSALQRGEEVEVLERMDWASSFRPPDKIVQLVTGGFRGRWFGGDDSIAERDLVCPHAIGDKIAVRCEYYSVHGCQSPYAVTCGCGNSPILTTVHSITARQVDGVWFWVLGVKLEAA